MPSSLHIYNNKKLFRFEIEAANEAETAYVQYRWLKANMVVLHIYVPPLMRGKGITNELAQFVLQYAAANSLKILPYCPIMAKYIALHPQYSGLVANNNK
jgi:uncharacterized protein